ncbi:GntR family transcriptional regulator [Cryptosporangium arvum]|uniref:Transcriptional regulator n=1 Tax=Cryptosporangium arvum DSM 44712 TaxID=927661 RepID=A0A010Z6R2_9ACTN|nr:GntR family transcriptional regulator [Cryptosporangium arvum]EXG83003.1 transcriptional regulator [Cryptosporangium arvum DSM 44712]
MTKPTLSEQIRDALLHRIVTGELAGDERLVETRIAAEFGTSQAPVREALRELEGLALIQSRPRHGRTVVPFAEQTIREAYVVRAALEEAATRLAMLRGSFSTAVLAAAVADMSRHAAADDRDGVCAASVAFHRHVVEAGDNLLLRRSWESLQIEARTMIALVTLEPSLTAVAAEHQDLLDVMRAGDVEDACRHAREHQLAYAELPVVGEEVVPAPAG